MSRIKIIQYRANQWSVMETSTKVFLWNTSRSKTPYRKKMRCISKCQNICTTKPLSIDHALTSTPTCTIWYQSLKRETYQSKLLSSRVEKSTVTLSYVRVFSCRKVYCNFVISVQIYHKCAILHYALNYVLFLFILVSFFTCTNNWIK